MAVGRSATALTMAVALMGAFTCQASAQRPGPPLQILPPMAAATAERGAPPAARKSRTTRKTTRATARVTAATPSKSAADARSDGPPRSGAREIMPLMASLPWGRSHPLQPVNYGTAEAESAVLIAADAWLAARAEAASGSHGPLALDEDVIAVADPAELNDIDLAAGGPPLPTFLQSLTALLGNAVSTAAAFVRRLIA